MKTAKNTNKTIMNQYLIPLSSRIESRLILPALLVSMFILTACVGSITVPTTISNPNTQSFCEANPFRHSCNQAASETARKKIIAECEAGQASNLCGDATAYSCYLNPENPQCDTVVQKSCDANPFKQQCAQGEFESARENIITECTTDRSGNLCGEATGYSCYLNPNGALCEQKDGLQEDTVNTNTNNEIASLKDDLQKANNAKTTADNDITRLKNELATAIGERDSATGDKDTANLRITELEGELSTAEGERDTAKGRITTLEGELSTAISERDTANGTITTLEGKLQTANNDKSTADLRIITLQGELSTATGERDTARGRITTLEGQLSTATGERDTAKDRITELEGQLSTAISERDAETGDKTAANLRITELQGELSAAKGERDIANGKVTTLEGQLSTATGALSTANGKITTLEGELSTATGERDTARDKVTDLEGELSTAKGERDTARGKVTELEGELQTATGDKDTANLRITELEGKLQTAEGERDTAKSRITTLEGELSTAIGERDTANGTITTLQGQLQTATGERDTANGRITDLEGELSTAKGERDTAIGERDTVIGERDTAIDERNTARGRITTLEGQLSTATGERDTAKDRITELEGQLSTAISERDAETGDKTTANLRITELEGQLSTATEERDTANGMITTLQGELSTAKDERDTANGKVTTLQGQLETAQGALSTANGKVLDLEGQLSTVTGERDTARDKVTDLEGQLETAISDKNTANMRIATLEDEATQAGIAKTTADAEIARLDSLIRPTYNNWERSVNPDATADLANPRHQILQGKDGTLDTTGVILCRDSDDASHCGAVGSRSAPFVENINLHSSPFDGQRINGDINDGYARFFGYIDDGQQYGYVGILDSTDLGAPLTGDAGTSVQWNGRSHGSKDFTLTITFESAGGRLDAFVNRYDGVFYRLQNARFDINGLITGTVNHQAFTGGDPTKPIDTATDRYGGTGDAVLSGIIGEEGMVAVFAGAGGIGTGRVGGFIAGPDIAFNPDVRTSDWLRSFRSPLPYSPAAATGNSFLQGTTNLQGEANGLDTTGITNPIEVNLNLATATFEYIPIGGDETDGVAFFRGSDETTHHYYAGVLPGTDLGAPLTQTTGSVKWNGQFSYIAGAVYSTDFVLTIDFGIDGGTLDAFFQNAAYNLTDYYHTLTGNFDKSGLISGNVKLTRHLNGDRNNVLTDTENLATPIPLRGLIGQEGAVGVFNTGGSSGGRNGGFVASPTAVAGAFCRANLDDSRCHGYVEGLCQRNPNDPLCPDNDVTKVTAGDWLRSFATPLNTKPTAESQFLMDNGAGTLDTTGLTVATSSGIATVRTLNMSTATYDGVPLGGDATDGIAHTGGFLSAGTGNRGAFYRYAGILAGTDLGAPLTQISGTARWNGQFVTSYNRYGSDFTLNITFNSDGGSIDAFAHSGLRERNYLITGTFDKRGVISGSFLLSDYTNNDRTMKDTSEDIGTGKLSGLIGTEGAVGVFIPSKSAGGTVYRGGFVANPTAISKAFCLANLDDSRCHEYVVTYADWVADKNPDAVPDLTNTRRQFLQSKDGTLDTTGLTACADSNNQDGCGAVGSRTAPFVFTGNLNTSRFDGRFIRGDRNDGYASFLGYIGETEYGYVGILDSTDLGAPLTGEAETSVQWNGVLVGRIGNGNFEFVLTITFDAYGGRLDAFINHNRNLFYRLQNARFDTGGVITGTVNYQFFTDSDPTQPIDSATDALSYTGDSVLSGIIGQEGAVAVFAGAGGVGGFVASPTVTLDPNKINFADWGGTAEAPKTDVIDSAGTGRLPLLNGAASVGTSNLVGNFIQGLPTVDDKGFDFAGTPFPSATVYGDILLLEAGSPSGVAFSSVYGTGGLVSLGNSKGYAGLLPGTNLGAPITDISTSAIWDAKFAAINVIVSNAFRWSNPDFKMRVTFNGSTGEINSGTVSSSGAFIPGVIRVPQTHNGNPTGRNDFNIQGRFGSDGLLYGDVDSGKPLTGLIGSSGAVGVFVGSTGIAGGFVAKPPVISPDANSNIVNYADWTRRTTVRNADGTTGIVPLLNGAASVGNTNPRVNFIQGLPTVAGKGFDFADTNFRNVTIRGDVLLLAAGSPSGVAFSNVSGTGVTKPKGYAGLLPGTNLGAPITDISTAAIWDAKLQAVFVDSRGVYRYSNPGFKMQVTFNGSAGTINSGTVSGSTFTAGLIDVSVTLNGSFDSNGTYNIQGRFGRDGLLYGTVNSTPLTGLIGQDGAVGAFVASGTGWAGGFVAGPPVVIPPDANPNIVNYADWTRATTVKNAGGIYGALPLLNGAASVDDNNPTLNFIQGLSTLRGQGFDFANTPFSSASVVGDILLLEAGSPSGVAFSNVSGTGVAVNRKKAYAGLLPGTNLGAPITDITTDAIWDAKFEAIFVNCCGNVYRYSPTDFKMQVTFDGSAGTINSGAVSNSGAFTLGAISVPYTFNGIGSPLGWTDYNIQGRFGSDGLLYGTVGGNPLTGLIGSSGAVGAFVNSNGIAGGFVAKPPVVIPPDANPNIVNYADWTRATTVKNADGIYDIVPLLNGVASVGTTNPDANFVQGLPLSAVADKGFNFADTNFRNVTVAGDVLLLEAGSPSGVAFSGVTLGNVEFTKGYAGLLPTTNLGAPITDPSTSAIWDAKFDGIFAKYSRVYRYSNLDFKMQVTFNGSTGEINSGTVSGSTFTAGAIDVPRTLNGIHGRSIDFNIQGKFGRDGLLYGTVREELDSAPLTGLIGQNGAVGAFVDTAGFAGGFVAKPPVISPDANSNIVNYADWTRTTTVKNADGIYGALPLLNGAASVGNANPAGNFIQGLALSAVADKGFNFADTNFRNVTVAGDILLLEAGSPSGVAFSGVTLGNVAFTKGYAGLLPGTNLGAPITDSSTSAIWDAKFAAINVIGSSVYRWSNPDFKMRVTFNGSTGEINSGTVSSSGAFIPGIIRAPATLNGSPDGSSNVNIQGRFGSDGLLYGYVDSAKPLTGLIGSGGAVGAFVNNGGLAGGFVAKPPVISPDANSNIVNYADWTRATTVKNADGIYGALPLLNGASSVGNANPAANFIQGLPTVAGKGFNFAGTGFPSASVAGDVLLLEAGSPSGIAFSVVTGAGVTGTGEKAYAGLLPGTNLGAPITDINTSAIWDAKLEAIAVGARWSNPGFKMQVTFNGSEGTIKSGTVSGNTFTSGQISVPYTIPDSATTGSDAFNIQGKFDSDGLLYGTVSGSLLTGLIGQNGAVGAFVNSGGLAGGFVAGPPPPPITFADWGGTAEAPKATVLAGSSGTRPLLNGAASVGTSNPFGNFIQGLPTVDDKGFDFAGTAFADATVVGDVLLLAENSPSGVAFSTVYGTGVTRTKAYAGLLPGTNLGAPITDPNTSAIWDAEFMAVLRGTLLGQRLYSNPSFKMQVTFDGSAGTINSGTVSGNTFTSGQISVPYTIPDSATTGSDAFNIQGKFDSDGLLYGKVVFVQYHGIGSALTGLIGVDGAVGALWISNNYNFYLAGGFVAKPQ